MSQEKIYIKTQNTLSFSYSEIGLLLEFQKEHGSRWRVAPNFSHPSWTRAPTFCTTHYHPMAWPSFVIRTPSLCLQTPPCFCAQCPPQPPPDGWASHLHPSLPLGLHPSLTGSERRHPPAGPHTPRPQVSRVTTCLLPTQTVRPTTGLGWVKQLSRITEGPTNGQVGLSTCVGPLGARLRAVVV